MTFEKLDLLVLKLPLIHGFGSIFDIHLSYYFLHLVFSTHVDFGALSGQIVKE